jgi:hypothetical protein
MQKEQTLKGTVKNKEEIDYLSDRPASKKHERRSKR